MKRWHEDVAHMQRQKKIANRDWPRHEDGLGRYRKRKAMDCGRAQCGLCHSDKYFSRMRRLREKRDAIRFELEQI